MSGLANLFEGACPNCL